MKKEKGSVSCNNLSPFPSPGGGGGGGPNYWPNATDPRGWGSERVPRLVTGGGRRNISVSSLTPFYSGRPVPSKWEDAERWICSSSPVNSNKSLVQAQVRKRPKSKSGPIVPPLMAYSPVNNVPSSSTVMNSFMLSSGSALSMGVLKADNAASFGYYGGLNGVHSSYPLHSDINNGRLGHIAPTWSDSMSQSSLPSSQDEIEESSNKEEALDSSCFVVTKRDMATQMSPDEKGKSLSTSSSSSPSFSPSSPTFLSIVEPQSDHTNSESSSQVKDVQVDQKATFISWSKGQKHRFIKNKGLNNGASLQEEDQNVAMGNNTADTALTVSKFEREEAKIKAWENLQKAKAEAAIRKLEMKLEKLRSLSMDKILNKLRKAQIKAHRLRRSLSMNQRLQRRPKNHSTFQSLKLCFLPCHAS